MPYSLNFILRTNPMHLEENIPLDKVIEVDLMVDLNRNEFNDSLVILYNITERKNIPIRAEYMSRSIKIYPLVELEPNMHYEVTLLGGDNKGLKTITGRYLEESYVFEFFTKDTNEIKPPTITSPTHLTEVYGDVTFEWITIPDAFYYELQVSKSNNFDLLVWPTEDNVHVYDGFATPDIAYTKGTYYARMRSVDRDRVCSSWSEPIQFYYDGENEISTEQGAIVQMEEKTESISSTNVKRKISLQTKSTRGSGPTQITALQQRLMATALEGGGQLYVSKTTPKHNSLNLPLEQLKEIVIEFSDKVDPASLTRETVYLIAERN